MPNRLRPNAELTRDVANAGARRGQQDHPGALRQLPWRRMRAHQPGENLLLGGGGHNGFGTQRRLVVAVYAALMSGVFAGAEARMGAFARNECAKGKPFPLEKLM